MMKKGAVRFKETPMAIKSESSVTSGGNTPLLKALALDDSTSMLSVSNMSDDVDKENSILSSGPSERANYVGRTPHSKVIEAAKVRKSFDELMKIVPMPMQVTDMSTFSTGSPIKQTVEMSGNEMEGTFNRTVHFNVAPATPSPMQSSELSGPSSQELTPTDFNITGLSNTPSSCGSDNFDLVGAVAENISSHMPSHSSKESRKFAGHTPFPDAKHRPELNSKSPDSEISQALWASGSSQMSPMSSAHDVSQKLLTPHQQSMQSICINSTPANVSQQSPVVHSGSGSHVSSDAQSTLSFLLPDYSPTSAGPSPAHAVQRSESQQSTPMVTLPVAGNFLNHPANGSMISAASSLSRSAGQSASVHQMTPQMISHLMAQGTPVLLIPSVNMPGSESASSFDRQAVSEKSYAISPAAANPVGSSDDASMATPVAVPMLRAGTSPNPALAVNSNLAPTTPGPLLATISTPSSIMSAMSQLTSTSVSTFPQLPQQASRSVQNTPAMVYQPSGNSDLPSPVVLAMDGGVARGRGPTGINLAPSVKPVRPPLPHSVSQAEQKQQRIPSQPPSVQSVENITNNSSSIVGIAAQSPLRAPATSKSWFTPRNTRKQLPYQIGVSRPAHSQPVQQQVLHTAPSGFKLQSAGKSVNQSVSVLGNRAEASSVMDMDSLNDPAEVCNVSIQCDAASIARMLSVASGGKADAGVNTSFCSTNSTQYGANSLASAGFGTRNRNHEHHQLIKEVNAMLSPICDYDQLHDMSECEEGSIQSSYCLEDYLKEANQHIERNHVFYNSGQSHASQLSPAVQQPFDTGAVLLAPSPALSQKSRPTVSSARNSRQASGHHSALLDRTQTTGTTLNYPQPSLLSGAGRVLNGQVSYTQSPASSDCSSITLNKSQFPAQDLTILTDVAVANYTLDMIDVQPTMMMDTILEEQSVVSAQSSVRGPATPTHNNSVMTGPDMTLFLDISQHTNMYPKLAIKSLQRNSSPSSVSSVMDIKEVVLQAAPGEVTTVMLTFHNHKNKPIVLKTSSVCVRFDMTTKESDTHSVNTQNNTDVFGISPGKLIIPGKGEQVLFVSFTPHAGLQGVYTGAMQIKDSKKTFTMLLRGEAFTQYSIREENSAPSTPDSKPQYSRVMSTIAKSVSPAQNVVVSATSKQSSRTPLSTNSGSTEKSGFSEKLKALHEKVAEVSRSVLYYETSQHMSPVHKQATNVGIASSPCSFIIEKKGTSSQQSVTLVKGAFTLQSFFARPKVIRCKISDPKLFHLSTNLLILYPNQEQHVSLSINEGHEEEFVEFARTLYNKSQGSPLQEMKLTEIAVQFDDQTLTVPVTITRTDLLLLFGATYDLKKETVSNTMHQPLHSVKKAPSFPSANVYPTPMSATAQLPVAPTTSGTVFSTATSDNAHRTHLGDGIYNTSQMSTQSAKRREGLYFRKTEVNFGDVAVGTLVRGKIELCNATDRDLKVYIGDLQLPFVLSHSEVLIKPRSYVKVPVRFLPVSCGVYAREMIAQSADGLETALIKLSGSAKAARPV